MTKAAYIMYKLAQTGGEAQTPASIAQTAQQNNNKPINSLSTKSTAIPGGTKTETTKKVQSEGFGDMKNSMSGFEDRMKNMGKQHTQQATSKPPAAMKPPKSTTDAEFGSMKKRLTDPNFMSKNKMEMKGFDDPFFKGGGLTPWAQKPAGKIPAPPEGNSKGQKIPPQKPKGKYMNRGLKNHAG